LGTRALLLALILPFTFVKGFVIIGHKPREWDWPIFQTKDKVYFFSGFTYRHSGSGVVLLRLTTVELKVTS